MAKRRFAAEDVESFDKLRLSDRGERSRVIGFILYSKLLTRALWQKRR